ncbi:MAG: ABC transporter permease, partial [Lachnospiraceae bacterium]|nr:ABC transporter permease [Lachnospiraceae bacterium]
MKLSDLLLMSLESLFKRKVRTILTIMGVVIGTTSIVVMISLGIGMKEALLSEYESYGGLRSIEVESAGRYDDSGKEKNPEDTLLNDARIEEFMSIDHVTSVDPILSTQVIIKCGIYECNTELLGVNRDVLEQKAEALGQGSIPAEGDGLQLIWGTMMPAYFVNTRTNQYEYWETGNAPNIDFMNDQMFVIFDVDKYYQSQWGSEDGTPVSAPKKYIIPTAGVIAGDLDTYNEDSYYVYCDIDALKEVLSREFRGRVIPGQPTRKNGKPYKELFYTRVNVNVDEMDNVTMVQQIINDMGYRA